MHNVVCRCLTGKWTRWQHTLLLNSHISLCIYDVLTNVQVAHAMCTDTPLHHGRHELLDLMGCHYHLWSEEDCGCFLPKTTWDFDSLGHRNASAVILSISNDTEPREVGTVFGLCWCTGLCLWMQGWMLLTDNGLQKTLQALVMRSMTVTWWFFRQTAEWMHIISLCLYVLSFDCTHSIFCILCTVEGEMHKFLPICVLGTIDFKVINYKITHLMVKSRGKTHLRSWGTWSFLEAPFILEHDSLTCLASTVCHHLIIATYHIVISPKLPVSIFLVCCHHQILSV